MQVLRHLGGQQRDTLHSAILPNHVWTETRSIAHVNRHATLQVGQGKVRRSIAAIGGAKQRKQSRILCNGQQLPITQCPALRGKVESNHQDRSKIYIRHRSFPFYGCTALWEITASSNPDGKLQIANLLSRAPLGCAPSIDP